MSKVVWAVLVTMMAGEPVGAVTLDAVTTGSTTTSPLTVSHTVTSSGSNRAIFVMCGIRSKTVTLTATYNSVAMNEVRSDVNGGSTEVTTYAFELTNPSTGTNDWVVTQSSNANMVCYARSATDVDQTTPVSDHDGVCANTGTSASVTLTSGTSDVLLDVLVRAAITQSVTQGANQTDEIDPPIEVSTNTTGAGSTQSGADGGAMSWSWSSSGATCLSAINIQHSTATDMPGEAIWFY